MPRNDVLKHYTGKEESPHCMSTARKIDFYVNSSMNDLRGAITRINFARYNFIIESDYAQSKMDDSMIKHSFSFLFFFLLSFFFVP